MSRIKLELGRRHRGARGLSGALLAATSFGSSVAGAQQPETSASYQLHWVREGGAESCASGAALDRWLEQVLAGRRALPGAARLLEGSARIAAPPLRFTVRVTVRDADTGEVIGERELTTSEAQCSALTPALLLVLAMSVDPDAGRDGWPAAVTEELQRSHAEDVNVWPVAPIAPVLPVAPRSVLPKVAATATTAADAPRSNASAVQEGLPIFGAAALSTGILPSLAVGLGLGTQLSLRRGWQLSLMAFGWSPQTVALPDSQFLDEGGVEVAAGQVSVALCRSTSGDTVVLSGCGGLGAGLRWLKARALLYEDNPASGFFGPEVSLGASLHPSPTWFVGAGAAGHAQLQRARFVYKNHVGEKVPWFEPSWFSSRFWLSVGVTL